MEVPSEATGGLSVSAIAAAALGQLEDVHASHTREYPWPMLEGPACAPPAQQLGAGEQRQEAVALADATQQIEGCLDIHTEGGAVAPAAAAPAPAPVDGAEVKARARPEDAACRALIEAVVAVVGGAIGRLRQCDRRELASCGEARAPQGDEVRLRCSHKRCSVPQLPPQLFYICSHNCHSCCGHIRCFIAFQYVRA